MNKICMAFLEDIRSTQLMVHIFCFALGIAMYFYISFEPSFMIIAALGSGAVVLGALTRVLAPCDGIPRLFHFTVFRYLAAGIALFAAGFCLIAIRSASLAAPMLSGPYSGPVSGVVSMVDQSQSGALRLTIEKPRLHRSPEVLEKIRFSVRYTPFYEPKVGDYITAHVELFDPSGPAQPYGFDFRRYAYFKQLSANGYAQSGVVVVEEAARASWAESLANRLEARFNQTLSPMSAGFAGAIFLGRRAYLDTDMKQALRETNLSHLLAISGLHVGILAGFIFMVTRRGLGAIPSVRSHWPIKKIAAITALLSILGYLQFTGAATPTQRAVFMASIALIAIVLDLRILNRRSVVLAAFLLLFLRPESLMEQGFQMSFAATLVLVIGFQTLGPRLPKAGLTKFCATLALASFLAGAATAPFVAYHFHILSKAGFLANLLVVPIMSIWVMPMGLVAIVLDLVTGISWLFPLVDWGIWLMYLIAQWIAQFENQIWHIAKPNRDAFFIFIAIAYLALTFGRKYIWGFAPLILFWGFFVTRDAQPQFLVNRDGALWAERNHAGVLAFNTDKKDRFTQRIWLQNNGQREVGIHSNAPENAQARCRALEIKNCNKLKEMQGPFATFQGELISAQDASGQRPWSEVR